MRMRCSTRSGPDSSYVKKRSVTGLWGTHRVLIIGRRSSGLEEGDTGLSLEEAKAANLCLRRRRRSCRCSRSKQLYHQGLELQIHTTSISDTYR
jgi:hypothetical protein